MQMPATTSARISRHRPDRGDADGFLTQPASPVQSIADLIAAAKKDPGKINIGSSPKGTGSHLCAELFMATAGVK